MAGLCAPLSTLRQYPHGYLRMPRGRCGSLLLHRDGLAPSTPCRSPGALRSTPISRHFQCPSACLKGAKGAKGGSRPSIAAPDVSDELISYYRERKTGEQVRSHRGSPRPSTIARLAELLC